MKFNVVCRVKCYNCPARDKDDDGDQILTGIVEADNQREAMNKFKDANKNCRKCSAAGTEASIKFDDFIEIEQLPSL